MSSAGPAFVYAGCFGSWECLQCPEVMPMSCLKDFANAATDPYACVGGASDDPTISTSAARRMLSGRSCRPVSSSPGSCLQQPGVTVDCRNFQEVGPYLLVLGGWYDLTQQERQSRRTHIPCGLIGGHRAPSLHSQHPD